MTAHAEIVVRAPDGDVLGLTGGTVPEGGREMLRAALEIGENAVATFRFQLADGVGEVMAIAHPEPYALRPRIDLRRKVSTAATVNLS